MALGAPRVGDVCSVLGRAAAQVGAALLTGVVSDPGSGAAVPGATVTARSVQTNRAPDGRLERRRRLPVPNLAPGVYDVLVELSEVQALQASRKPGLPRARRCVSTSRSPWAVSPRR